MVHLSGCDTADLLRGYAACAHHRTGTAEDDATLALVEAACFAGGARVGRIPFGFPRYDWEATVAVDGVRVRALPLYYAAAGAFALSARRVAVIGVEPGGDDGLLRGISRAARQAQTAGARGLLVATRSATSGLYAPNVICAEPGTFPVWLIAATDVPRAARIEARLEACVRPGRSATLMADYGSGDGLPALVVTTPLSGWFACVGERGGGLVLALKLCEALSRRRRVRLIATSGHELGHLGAAAARTGGVMPDRVPVLHLGSCLATAGAQLQTLYHATAPVAAGLAETLQPIGDVLRAPDAPADPASWQGESAEWASAWRPMVSVAGTSPAFHTPQDTDVSDVLARLAPIASLLEQTAELLCQA